MRLADKTPAAKRYARSYCRRCLAVMVCCVLVFGLTVRVQPRAKAVAETALAGVGGGLSSNPIGASIALSAMLGCGVGSFVSGYANAGDGNIFYGTRGYEAGAACWDYLYGLGGDIYDWCVSTRAAYEDKGGVAPGDSFEIPAEVAEAIRQWTVTHFDFADGVCTYEDFAFNKDGNCFVLSDVDTAQLDASTSDKYFNCTVRNVGSLVKFHAGDFSEPYEIRDYITDDIYCVSRYTLTEPTTDDGYWSGAISQRWYLPSFSDDTSVSGGLGSSVSNAVSKEVILSAFQNNVDTQNSFGVLFRSSATNRLYCGVYTSYNGIVRAGTRNYCDLIAIATPEVTMTTTITPSDTIDTPVTQAVTVTIPADLPTTTVGDYSIPVFTDLTAEDVLNPGADVPATDTPAVGGITAGEITGAIEDALPVTGTVAGDQVVAEVAEDPDSLGDVFISKFPFSIPWDIAKAVSLLAAPPVTPRWEINFYESLEGQWGFHAQGDTSIVIDFERFEFLGMICRWVTTVMFVYALASATKKFIWTS